MKIEECYDVICSGDSLSTYVCGALLAKSGKKVLVIGEDYLSDNEDLDSLEQDFGLFAGLNGKTRFLEVMEILGINRDEFVPLDAVTQVLTPTARIVFGNDLERTTRELQREVQLGLPEFLEFFSNLYQSKSVSGFADNAQNLSQMSSEERGALKRFWKDYFYVFQKSHPSPLLDLLSMKGADLCEKICSAVLGSLSYSSPQNLGAEQTIRSLALFLGGMHAYRSRTSGFKKRLIEIIKSHGGSIKKNSQVNSLIAEGKDVSGVLLSSYEGIVHAKNIVVCNRLKKLYLTLPQLIQDKVILRGLNRIVPSAWRFTISLKVNKNVIPTGVTTNMVYIGSERFPLEEDNYLRIHILDNDDNNISTILVTALVPYRSSTMDYAYIRRLSGKILQALTNLFPFLEYNTVSITPDFRSGQDELKKYYPFAGLDWVPHHLMQFYVRGYREAQEFWGASWTTTHPNLYFAGRSIWPSLGTYGEILSAFRVYEDIRHK